MVSCDAIKKRLKEFRSRLQEKGLDAALVSMNENLCYLSGFTGDSTYLVITQNEAVLVTDFRYVEQARAQAALYETIQYQGSLIAALAQLLKSKNIQKLGFEEAHVTYSQYTDYKQKLEVSELIPLGGIIENLRIVKDEEELDIIKKAVKIADGAFTHVLGYIRPGVTELEIAAEIEYFMKKSGATAPSFETIAASGARAAMPHGVASEKKLEMGDVITLDFGALYNKYCSDMTRTVFLGQPNEEIKKIYNIVLKAQLAALEGARKGLLGKEVDAVARDLIAAEGYGKNFGHGLGHGVGLEIHEQPRLSPSGEIRLENNMVVTVEPGIYVEGLGGVRIEDIIVIKDDTPLILTQSTKEMIII